MMARTRVRAPARRTLTTQISTGEGDQIERTADRVRLNGRQTVHELVDATTDTTGRVYETRCDALLFASDGAMLTTRPVTCETCSPAALPAQPKCTCKPHPVFGHEDKCRYQGMGR